MCIYWHTSQSKDLLRLGKNGQVATKIGSHLSIFLKIYWQMSYFIYGTFDNTEHIFKWATFQQDKKFN